MNEEVQIDRTKKSIPNTILERFEIKNYIKDKIKNATTSSVTYVDIINVFLEKGKSNTELRSILSKINEKYILEQILGLLILKNRYTLVSEIANDSTIRYDPIYINLAIENDSFDIMFLLRDMFPQSYTRSEELFLEPILASFTKSNTCWLAK